MNLDELNKAIVKHAFKPTAEQMVTLRNEILSQPAFFIIAAPGTTQEQWARKSFAAYTGDDKTLPVFLSQSEADLFAAKANCVLPTGQPLVVRADRAKFSKILAEYDDSQIVDMVRVYTRPPIHLELEPAAFFAGQVPERAVSAESTGAVSGLVGVDVVKQALDTFEKNARRRLDPGARFENIHTLVEELIHKNHLAPEKVDAVLGLQTNFTRNFCRTVKSDPPQKIVANYLRYFGLEAYLYVFRKDCSEIQKYLNEHGAIDTQKLKYPPALTAERFTLRSIARGSDNMTGAYVYKATLVSKMTSETVELVLSDPLDPALVIDRDYQLLDHRGESREEDKAALRPGALTPMPSDEELMQTLTELEERRNGGPKPKHPASRSYEETRRDGLILYLKKTENANLQKAEALLKNLESEPDILDEFYQYTQHGPYGKIEVLGYTTRKLMKELHYRPYDAYLNLVLLRTEPQNTRQRLKYRERDPQYQNRKPEGARKQ